MPKFLISLKRVHEASGYSQYRVAKDTGVNINTVKKYVGGREQVVQDSLPSTVLRMCDYYGVDWHDVVDVIPNGTDKAAC